MAREFTRRDFVKTTMAGCALCTGCAHKTETLRQTRDRGLRPLPDLISPGCRGTRVKVARIYAGIPGALWPTPKMDLEEEIRTRYEPQFAALRTELSDVEFVGSRLVTSVEAARQAREGLADVDGVLIIHLSMGIMPIVRELLAAGKPTLLFAVPYSGHEWTGYGALEKEKSGALLNCMLTADTRQLAAAIRPFRAIHHLREAKILNISAKPWPEDWVRSIADKFGTQVSVVSKERALQAYEAVSQTDAQAEATRWIGDAVAVVEPSRDEVVRSCRLALAFENLLKEEGATVITADCYGSMYHQLPAFPCVGFVRLNNLGLGGICESDMRSAMTHIIMQGLVGRPGFISDPTMDESTGSIILAHCLGSMNMDGPDGPTAPYKLRTIMERQEGCVPQVKMRVGQDVTQAILVGADLMPYFTGRIIDAPETERGCRTKITVKVDGDARRLWQNWNHGLHRVTCYGNLRDDLQRFCRYKAVQLTDEAG